jgi:16S rRNA (guanine527-N7)-methyltransferase
LTKRENYLIQLKDFFAENNLPVDLNKLEKLADFAELLAEKNESINLISRKDIKNVVENHIFHSVLISEHIPDKRSYFLDIGTGGGFPGIPVAIMRPELRGVLVDSTRKKIEAVDEFLRRLALKKITAENYRVESQEFIEKYKNSFDLILSRATVPLALLIRYALPLIQERAVLISAKGGDLKEELRLAELKYKINIRKSTIFELAYKPSNPKNEKGKKLIVLELTK